MNRFNWSQAFGGLGDSAQEAGRTRMQRDIAEMQAARAENLARFQLNKQLQFEGWRTQYDATHQENMMQRQEAIRTVREKGLQARQESMNEAYMNRILAAQNAEAERERTSQSGMNQRQQQQQIYENRIRMQQDVQAIDAQKIKLQSDIQAAVSGQSGMSIRMIQDPNQRHQAMAQDPTIGPMLEQLATLDRNRASTITAYTLYGNSLGDPLFKGPQKLDDITGQPGSATGAGTPSFDTSGGGAATPNNPLDQQVPGYPTDNAADNAPATDPKAAPTSAPSGTPGASGAGMPPTVGQTRPPTQTAVGPLARGPQLIPAGPDPGLTGPAGFGGLGGAAPPSLIPASSTGQ